MNSQHYTHLVKIEFNDDDAAYYDGYFDLESANEGMGWQREYLAKEGYDIKSVTVIENNQ